METRISPSQLASHILGSVVETEKTVSLLEESFSQISNLNSLDKKALTRKKSAAYYGNTVFCGLHPLE
jgi:hypothetical protein